VKVLGSQIGRALNIKRVREEAGEETRPGRKRTGIESRLIFAGREGTRGGGRDLIEEVYVSE
jgi:hypothetical protein